MKIVLFNKGSDMSFSIRNLGIQETYTIEERRVGIDILFDSILYRKGLQDKDTIDCIMVTRMQDHTEITLPRDLDYKLIKGDVINIVFSRYSNYKWQTAHTGIKI